jgi:hypothetical protein
MIRALTGRVEDVLTPRVREALPTRTGPTYLSELGLSTTPKSPRDSYRLKNRDLGRVFTDPADTN